MIVNEKDIIETYKKLGRYGDYDYANKYLIFRKKIIINSYSFQ